MTSGWAALFDSRRFRVAALLILAVLVVFPVFGHLESLTISPWDESRLAMNALEMYFNGDWIVTKYNGQPDLWNTKPPLMIWLQTALMHLFGPGELAVRLPSALASLGVIVIVFVFCAVYLKRFWLGLISVLFLISSSDYIGHHCSRTGDYDSLLVFFIFSYCITFFIFLESTDKKWLYLTAAGIVLAILTKGIAGIMFLPGLLIFTIISNKTKLILTRHLFISGIIILFFSAACLLIRENSSSGYINAVLNNDVIGRYSEVLEKQQHPFEYYFARLFEGSSFAWMWIAGAGFILGAIQKNVLLKRFNLFLFVSVLFFVLIISFSATKKEWYVVPVFPFLAIASGTCVSAIHDIISSSGLKWKHSMNGLLFIIFIWILFPVYMTVFNKTQSNPATQPYSYEYFLPNYLRTVAYNGYKLDYPVILNYPTAPHVGFYTFLIEKNTGQKILYKSIDELVPGDKITTQFNPHLKTIRNKFVIDSFDFKSGVYFFRIKNRN